MSKVIEVHNVSKLYRLGVVGGTTVSDDLKRWWASVTGKEDPTLTLGVENVRDQAAQSSYIWALKDVNFNVGKGEVVGIIGKNGAGKSTMLKLLAKVTGPTKGSLKYKGRIASLLEVGTGFHPELTGRENVYLNGTIMGMTKKEVRSKLDEIVSFSGVEQYIDTPVKRYSSGMKVRLGFSVAAHLEPEILIVDEVLAVGDVEFQKKCIDKMKNVAGEGRTILFVSHNLNSVQNLCTRAILLENGTVATDGPVLETIGQYLKSSKEAKLGDDQEVKKRVKGKSKGGAHFESVEMVDANGEVAHGYEMGETIRFKVQYAVSEDVGDLYTNAAVKSTSHDESLTSAGFLLVQKNARKGNHGTFYIELPGNNFRPNHYQLYFWLGSDKAKTTYDVISELPEKLIIVANEDYRNLGYDLSKHTGFFNVDAKLVKD